MGGVEMDKMTKSEVIKKLIELKGTSIRSIALEAGIPYTTLRSMLARGIGGAAIDNVIKVCEALGISLDLVDMANGDMELPKQEENIEEIQIKHIAAHSDRPLSEEEMEEIRDYARYVIEKHNKSKK
jgi:lambda repressor-like predicted transcriptional regulator